MRKLIAGGVGLVAVLALSVPGAFGSEGQAPGVTARTIKIGGTFPLTGPAAAYAPIPVGMKAYFSYINKRRAPKALDPQRRRGVFGRQIVWKYYDDGYNPANTVQLTRRLVEQDKVFATVGQLGTEHNLAVREYMNSKKVPQTLVSTGASYWGLEYKKYPWTIGWQPDYIAEGRLYGAHMKANFNGKKIGIIYQNDDYGKDYLYGVKAALGKAYANANVVAEEAFEVTATSLASQMSKIKASGATIFVILGTPTPTIRAYGTGRALGFTPEQIYVNSVGATAAFLNIAVQAAGAAYVNGSITVNYLKDPSNPSWDNDAAMKLYRSIMAKYAPSANASDQLYFYGVAKAETFVQALYKAGQNPTRASLMAALSSMNSANKFALPGVKQKTSKKDYFVISQMQLQRYTHPAWQPFGKLVDGRPRGR
ncbi:MAG TPA: ABC transporter substrate-binding protein [Gaiellaceae bacterium]|nr:ABC transporter substrate-binding protein [Gaiellaceae bacterium]